MATTPSLVTSSAATTLTVNPVLPLTSPAVTSLSVTGKADFSCPHINLYLFPLLNSSKGHSVLITGIPGHTCNCSLLLHQEISVFVMIQLAFLGRKSHSWCWSEVCYIPLLASRALQPPVGNCNFTVVRAPLLDFRCFTFLQKCVFVSLSVGCTVQFRWVVVSVQSNLCFVVI